MRIEKIKVGRWTVPIFETLICEPNNDPKVRQTGTHKEGLFGLRYSYEFHEKMPKPNEYVPDVIFAVSDDRFELQKLITQIAEEKGWL